MLVSGRVFIRTSTYSTWQVYRRITRPCSHTKYLQYWVPGSVAALYITGECAQLNDVLSLTKLPASTQQRANVRFHCRTHGEFQWFATHPNGYEDTEAAKLLQLCAYWLKPSKQRPLPLPSNAPFGDALRSHSSYWSFILIWTLEQQPTFWSLYHLFLTKKKRSSQLVSA